MILYIGFLISFVATLFIGLQGKKFIFLLIDAAIGAGIGILSTYLYFAITPPENIGFAIIALLPVVFIVFPITNIFLALVGGLIGIMIGKKRG